MCGTQALLVNTRVWIGYPNTEFKSTFTGISRMSDVLLLFIKKTNNYRLPCFDGLISAFLNCRNILACGAD